ncbi:helix-turn-helix domain-containing protein [Trinickia mobilis]|uniref:helix-turn-helix domain-containing protein n=1 Tax=Trinickia mobilis TaxID=2816356 RepID=UPI001A9061A3|nr:helix-turn-helix transcriptional regulator [Trinickia mobilis]
MPEDDRVNPFKCTDDFAECVEKVKTGNAVIGSRGDPKNKILGIEQGRVKVEGPHGQWVLVPAHMIFIPHSRPYRIYSSADAVVTVAHLSAQHTVWEHEGCWAAPINGLAKEMLGYALRWDRDRAADDPVADAYFNALGLLCKEWFQCSRMMWIPFGESAELKRAIAYSRTRLDSVTIELAAEAAGTSVRTLRRYFQDELGMSWRRFLRELRMTRAIELLTLKRLSVTQTALDVGFNSVAAFTLAFTSFTGKTPSTYTRDFFNSATALAGSEYAPDDAGGEQEFTGQMLRHSTAA